MRIIYMGTPDFAVLPLEKIIENGHQVVLVVTQPDRVRGRGKEVSFSPVKECAIKYNIPVFQPEKIRTEEAVAELKKYPADIFVVAAFGQILSEEILNMPKYGCVNIHASLLPKYRGAAPIQWSILDGEEKTGVTIQQMAKGLDTGDILIQDEIEISNTDTGESLFDKLMYLGADLLVKLLPMIENNEVIPVPQDEEKSTYASKITKEMGCMDFSWSAEKLERYVRGLNSWPSAYTTFNGKIMKIWGAEVEASDDEQYGNYDNGVIVGVNKECFKIKCAEGILVVKDLQLEGKKRMSAHDFMVGTKIDVGMKLG